MRGYKLTFFLAVLLLLAAVATKRFDKTDFGDLKTDTGSWFLLLGGLVMLVYGYVEYQKKKINK